MKTLLFGLIFFFLNSDVFAADLNRGGWNVKGRHSSSSSMNTGWHSARRSSGMGGGRFRKTMRTGGSVSSRLKGKYSSRRGGARVRRNSRFTSIF